MRHESVPVVIHIDEELSEHEIRELERELAVTSGVSAACVNDRSRHLVLVDYNPRETASHALLRTVMRHGYHAELVGF